MSQVDLSALRIDDAEAAVPKRPLGQRFLVVALIGLGLAVAATFLWPVLFPPRSVRMAAVRTVTAGSDAAAIAAGAANATTSTEAVGWVEADPFPVIVRPLVSGHIETLHVLEGAQLTAGETVIAQLVSADLQSAKERGLALVEEAAAQLQRARANERLATERREQNAEARLRLQEATTRERTTATRLDAARARESQATAQGESAAAGLRAQRRLAESGQSYPVALERARAEAAAADAAVTIHREEAEGLERELQTQRDTVTLCTELADRPVDLSGAVEVARAETGTAQAALSKAETELAIAERELEWATVLAPVDGVVLRLESQPGDMVGHGEKGVVAVYDPNALRARIDVPLDSLQGIYVGQKVEITSEAISGTVVQGVVQRLQHETDMLKNTLQVKIGLIAPPPLLRPETLCRARFLAGPPHTGGASAGDDSGAGATITAFRVPSAAVQGDRVFVFDPSKGTARPVAVLVVGEAGDDRIVRGDLSPTHQVILDPVEDGESIRPAPTPEAPQ